MRAQLERLEQVGLMRSLTSAHAPVDFSSNDYLGLSQNEEIRSRLIAELQNGLSLGATSSRLLRGTLDAHEECEGYLARVYACESALLFSSGYAANLGVLVALALPDTTFFSDELNHASIIDGIRLSGSAYEIFKHRDLNALEEKLKSCTTSRRVVVSESIFSMDGDRADVEALLDLAEKYDAWLVIDETHATGFGLGLATSDFPQLIRIHSGGKGLGAMGAFVLAPTIFKRMLVNRARTFIFSTGLSPLVAKQIQFAQDYALKHPELAGHCLANADYLRERLNAPGSTQILPVLVGGNERAMELARSLQDRGFDVRAVRAPTVPQGTERLRISVKAAHTQSQLEGLAGAIEEGLQHV